MMRNYLIRLGKRGVLLMPFMVAAGVEAAVTDVPLHLSTKAKPNIMMLLDNSGSMHNVVPDAPFDATVTYGCHTDSTVLSALSGKTVDIQISSTGAAYFTYNSATYDWGTGGTGATGVASHSVACFAGGDSFEARLYGDAGSTTYDPGNYLGAQYTGNYLNWFFGSSADGTSYPSVTDTVPDKSPSWASGSRTKPGVKRRIDVAKAATHNLLASMSDVRIGLSTYDGSSGAKILAGVADLGVSTHLATVSSAVTALTPSGSTPLAEALLDIGRYFVGTAGSSQPGNQTDAACVVNGQYDGALTLHPKDESPATNQSISTVFGTRTPALATGVSGASPICFECQKNFAILLTDGRPQSDREIPSVLRDYDRDCQQAADGCVDLDPAVGFDRKTANSYESEGSDYLDDVAKALNEIDLRPDVDDAAGEVVNNLITYTIGFADDQVINDQLMSDTAANGDGLFVTAADANALTVAFRTAIADIEASISSASAVVSSSTRLQSSTHVYQALFNSGDWTGSLTAFQVQASGAVASTPTWTATVPSASTRNVFAWNSLASPPAAMPFTVANYAAIQGIIPGVTSTAHVSYLRGDASNEAPNGLDLRARTGTLGDIVNSSPVYVRNDDYGYARLGGTLATSYETYRANQASRTPMLYVGANDGMLHGFNATTGVESFAYIPSATAAQLPVLYSTDYQHRFFVDGSPVVSDAYFGASWHSVLVGTSGLGGSGVFALDVTAPDSFDESKVLWDISAATTDFTELGYTLSTPSIARFKDGNFYAVFGNGVESTSQKSVLYLVQLDDPTNFISLPTDYGSAGSPNGMGAPLLVDTDGDKTVDAIYVGDLQGNLWKVDTTHTNKGQWAYAFGTSGAPLPLFVAQDAGGQRQPITAMPQAVRHTSGDPMVLFGTGKYDSVSDLDDLSIQSFYGILDKGAMVSNVRPADPVDPLDTSVLVEQKIVLERLIGDVDNPFTSTAKKHDIRFTSKKGMTAGKRGWFIDLKSPGKTEGERVVYPPLIRGERVVFVTLIPSKDPCGVGGTSWMMELNALNGDRLPMTPWDLNDNKLYDVGDKASADLEGTGAVAETISGVRTPAWGIIRTPGIVDVGKDELKISGGTSGAIGVTRESKDGGVTRQSWQQLR